MRILYVISCGYVCGGAEASVLALTHAMRAKGHDVSVLSADSPGENMFADRTFPRIAPYSPLKFFHHLFYFRSFNALRKAIREFHPDIVHFHTMGDCSPSVLFALSGTPAVLTVHGPEEYTKTLLPWYLASSDFRKPYELSSLTFIGRLHYVFYRYPQRMIYHFGLRRLSRVIAPSKYIAKEIAEDISVPIRQIYNGIPLPEVQPMGSVPVALYVGRLKEVKGVAYAFRAFAIVAKQVPTARLIVVGDGVERTNLAGLAKELGIEKNIEMHGWLSGNDEIYHLYGQSQVVLVPSVWPENLPTVCIEAMAIGRPVVGTKTGGIPELISDGESGFVVPMRDSGALAHAMLELFTNAPMREEMGKSARARAEHFHIERFVGEILALYNEVISETK